MSKLTTALLTMAITFGAQAADTLGLRAGVFDPPRMAPDFTVRGSDGKELKLSQYRGKLVLLEFGYTSCVDVCPVSLGMLAEARRQMGAQASQLQVIYVTVDPERDTPERMRNYLRAFDPTFIGATGTPQQMARVRQDYGITATKKMIDGSKTDYTVGHSSYLYFVDRKGSLRALLPFGRTAADVVHDATLLLKN
ncbi:SCO family protein [Duganella sp. BJB488]|uniref:SCO family protein n=1 Tax=unclassified Duganella TaxID=2636909 RepID=UPI000E3412D2|nr:MULTISPECIES: SCO family protein [unclassified Duganella]RFP20204.1 SCO family protein [Duganella sp. BJB489]RFP21348.1 SCO family protein [Duganella sp. BJB488]RFP33489.1 SCO family protein [Duganella sp. BJB480]